MHICFQFQFFVFFFPEIVLSAFVLLSDSNQLFLYNHIKKTISEMSNFKGKFFSIFLGCIS